MKYVRIALLSMLIVPAAHAALPGDSAEGE